MLCLRLRPDSDIRWEQGLGLLQYYYYYYYYYDLAGPFGVSATSAAETQDRPMMNPLEASWTDFNAVFDIGGSKNLNGGSWKRGPRMPRLVAFWT